MQPYDPLARLAYETSHAEVIAALELCLRFLTAASLNDLVAVQTTIKQRLTDPAELIDPLTHVYTTLSKAIAQRVSILEATLLWARQGDPAIQIVDHHPASWQVALASHEPQQVHVAYAPSADEDWGADTLTLLVNDVPVTIHIADDGSLSL